MVHNMDKGRHLLRHFSCFMLYVADSLAAYIYRQLFNSPQLVHDNQNTWSSAACRIGWNPIDRRDIS